MQWEGGEESSNVEDRRGMGVGGGVALGGGSILLVILGLIFGVDLGGFRGGREGQEQRAAGPVDDKTRKFVAVVLNYTEKVWDEQFRDPKNGYRRGYEKPRLVLFSDAVRTGCGNAPSSVGPFYCPADETVYLDPTFFDELAGKLGGSKAEFSQAYVIAHEVGHHVQNLLGYSALVDKHRGQRDEKQMSVRLELQADYLAGVWAHHSDKRFRILEPGDVKEAIKTAQSIGDDRLQKRSRGWVSPEGFTHGTSKQRMEFFDKGLKSGDATKARLDRFFEARYDAAKGEILD